MNHDADPDFAPIAKRIQESISRQGFMSHIGAQLSELARGSCTLTVDRRPQLLQQNGLFHGGVTAFLVDNATTIAAATSRGQPALTAEYKLNLLSPASGTVFNMRKGQRIAGLSMGLRSLDPAFSSRRSNRH